jgi:hypothetical protein
MSTLGNREYVDTTHIDVSLFIDRYSLLPEKHSKGFLPLRTYSTRVSRQVNSGNHNIVSSHSYDRLGLVLVHKKE